MKNKKVILKLSGESLVATDNSFAFDYQKAKIIAEEIKAVAKNIKIGIVIGAGNIFRARMIKNNEVSRVEADHIGMLATVLNAIYLSNILNNMNVKTRVLSSVSVSGFVEDYSTSQALSYWKEREVLIFCGGTGNPYFTTDTAAVLRALELKADIVLKATQVEGVYNRDPEKYKNAKMYKRLSYQIALEKKLGIMDINAFVLASENALPLRVFKMKKGNLKKVLAGVNLGTLIQ